MKLNKNDDNKLPFPVTLIYGMDIEEKDKSTMKNFCEDFMIENVVDDKYMALPIAVIEKVEENDPEGVQRIFHGPVRISNFRLSVEVLEGERSLIVNYESPMMGKYFDMISDMYTQIDHDPEFNFILSYNYEGDHDVDNLSYHFNRYLPIITASGDISGMYDDIETNAMMLGVMDEIEE